MTGSDQVLFDLTLFPGKRRELRVHADPHLLTIGPTSVPLAAVDGVAYLHTVLVGGGDRHIYRFYARAGSTIAAFEDEIASYKDAEQGTRIWNALVGLSNSYFEPRIASWVLDAIREGREVNLGGLLVGPSGIRDASGHRAAQVQWSRVVGASIARDRIPILVDVGKRKPKSVFEPKMLSLNAVVLPLVVSAIKGRSGQDRDDP
jgi:hypothetical protein